jgi:hypothetical protein
MLRPERRMWFRLAALWGCTVREAIARCDAEEFREWLAYYGLEPWTQDRADWRAGMVASVIANVNRGRGTPAYKAADFMPRFGPEPEQKRQPLSDMKAAFEKFAQVCNG